MEPVLTPGADSMMIPRRRSWFTWRTEQLWRLGLPRLLAETFADLVDWHALAELIERGCSPELALEIVR